MKPVTPKMVEGPEAFARFTAAMKQVLLVPRAKVKAQIEQHRKQAALNPNRRGPKAKVKPSATPDSGA
jgi:hypothetical protein